MSEEMKNKIRLRFIIPFIILLALWLMGLKVIIIQGPSMEPTLLPNDIILSIKAFSISVGDIVLLTPPDWKERKKSDRGWCKRIGKIEGDSYYFYGDNSAASLDSRHVGPITMDLIRKKVIWVYTRSHNMKENGKSKIDRLVLSVLLLASLLVGAAGYSICKDLYCLWKISR